VERRAPDQPINAVLGLFLRGDLSWILLVPCETRGGANEAPQIDLFDVPELRGNNAHPDQPINAVFGLFLRGDLTLVLLELC
jgi:hypothetical protein